MRDEEFRSFLTKKFRGNRRHRPLAAKPSGDAVSRCRRVEEVLGVNLDMALPRLGLPRILEQIRDRSTSFRFEGNVAQGITTLRTAVRFYAAFLGM